MRHLVLALLLVLAGVVLAPAGEVKIGLLCAGSTSDGGWNQLAKDAIERVRRDLPATVTVLQKVAQDRAGSELRDFAADGYTLVIAHGYEFLEPAAEAAKAGGATRFAVSGADVARPGIVTVDFDVSQASYQIGILAGRLTRSGKLGFLGGSPIPSVLACQRGFLAGARSVRPDATVAAAMTGWDDPAQAKAQAEAFIRDGIDALYPDVDAASRGVFEAVKEANARRGADQAVRVFGCVGDWNGNAICPDATVASAVIRLDETFLRLARAAQGGTLQPGLVREDLARGTCVTVLNPRLAGTVVTDAMQAEIAEAGRRLAAGEIAIPAQ